MQALADWLESTETTQLELAERMGVSQPSVSDWVTGRTFPAIDNLCRLSEITRIPVGDLIATRVA